jgi:aryl-alcohol dehydrogenase-like predicted oxidoreductase
MTARFRGWAPLVALQIEYSLLERTVEGDLIPMAREMGLGVTPWSPLKSGVLSGKYKRENHGKHEAGRGEWATSALNDKVYDLLDELGKIARSQETTVARVALAWVQSRPGVTSVIIGARTMKQLDDNLGGLDVKLAPQQLAKLEELSKPTLNFPAAFVENAGSFMQGGTTVNGSAAKPWPMSPKDDSDRY